MNAAGFTLLELLIALAIGGLLLAIVVPNLPAARSGAELLSAEQQAAAALRRARHAAIESGRAVAFDPASLKLPQGVRLAVEPEAGLRFHPDGSSNGGSVALASGSATRELRIDWLTGRVRHGE